MTIIDVSKYFEKVWSSSTPGADSVNTLGLIKLWSIIPYLILLLLLSEIVSCLIVFCEKYTLLLSMIKDTLDCALQFDNKHLLARTIQRNDFNNMIKVSAPKNNIYRPCQSIKWMVTVLKINKVTRKIHFTMVGLPPLIMQKRCTHWMVFWCLSLIFVLQQMRLPLVYANRRTRSCTPIRE